MGLIKALTSATSSTFGDQFKEYVTCPTVDNNVIIQRAVVKHGEGNKNYTEGVISAGSTIVVPQGMAMMLIDNGAIVEFTDTPGEYTWDNNSEPSIFVGSLGKGIVNTFKTIGKRFTYGGQPAKDQRVYYVNIKTLPAVPFGSQQPEVIYDPVYGSVEVTYNGEFNIKVDDPIILVNTMIGANPKDTLTFDDIFASDGRNILKRKFAQKVGEAISDIMTIHNVSFNRIQSYRSDITDKMNNLLDNDWRQNYGIIVADEVTLNINASESAKKVIQEVDTKVSATTRLGKVYSDNLTGTMAAATGEAMMNASQNEAGAMTGFMGMGFAQNQGANVIGAVNGTQSQGTTNVSNDQPSVMPGNVFGTNVNPSNSQNDMTGATCSNCGNVVTGKFCSNCGTKVETEEVKKCPNCGVEAKPGSKFCTQCGQQL